MATGRVEGIAEMLLDFGLGRIADRRFLKNVDGFLDSPALVQRPAERIGNRGVVGRELARPSDQGFGSVQVLAMFELRIAEEIEDQRLVRASAIADPSAAFASGQRPAFSSAFACSNRSGHNCDGSAFPARLNACL
jgi:hypothetical protein